ncbi:MAG: hypothetical protein LBT12_07160 [Oscillospiraceae bacterium]|jgi:hypothetical protein|nr:hypothetical protein [Oscillospiraceae bacterium]
MVVYYVDYKFAQTFSFNEVDADTREVTEVSFGENGELIPGEAATFSRVK